MNAALALLVFFAAAPATVAELSTGVRLHYEAKGKGPALLLIHGGGSDASGVAPVMDPLAKAFYVIAPDCRGAGRSSDPGTPLTYEAMADDMVALLNHLKIERAHVVGWSDGGIIGLQMALAHPERVDRIVAFGSNATPDGMEARALAFAATMGPDSLGPEKRARYEKVAPDPTKWAAHVEQLKVLWTTQPAYTADRLRTIKAPVLLATGDRDEFVRLEHTVEMYRAIPGAELVVMPDARHSLRHQDLELVLSLLRGFLAPPPQLPASKKK